MVQEANAGGPKGGRNARQQPAPSSGRLAQLAGYRHRAWPERELTWTR